MFDSESNNDFFAFLSGSKNRCTAGRVTEGERSTIVCHFNQDLNVTKGSFAVRKIREDGGLFYYVFFITYYFINTNLQFSPRLLVLENHRLAGNTVA